MIVVLHEKAAMPQGTYAGCVKTFDWATHDRGTRNSGFCKDIGARVREVDRVEPETLAELHLLLIEHSEAGACSMSEVPVAYANMPRTASLRRERSSDF